MKTKPPRKRRLDQRLVERRLASDLTSAASVIRSGAVFVDGQRIDKPGTQIPAGATISVREPRNPFASRGGLKLAPVLECLGIDVRDKVCLDLGASTGGFTDCLLQRGAQRVHAFDVGRGILDWSLRRDPRVVVREGVNVRFLKREMVGEPIQFATVDLSFISLRAVLPMLKPFAPIRILALIKPQFEAAPNEVGKGGVVRDETVRQRVIEEFKDFARREGFMVVADAPSPLPGAKGNREHFVLLEL